MNVSVRQNYYLKKDRSKYMCLPKDYMNQQRIVKGMFHKDMLKNE